MVPFQVVLFQVVQTDKLGRSSSLDSRDGSYISTLHLSSAMVITIKSLVSKELSFYLCKQVKDSGVYMCRPPGLAGASQTLHVLKEEEKEQKLASVKDSAVSCTFTTITVHLACLSILKLVK